MIVENALVQLGVAGGTLLVLHQTLTKLLPAILRMAMRPIEEIMVKMSGDIGELTTELRLSRTEYVEELRLARAANDRTGRTIDRIETKIDMQYDLTPSPQDLPRTLSRSKKTR